MFLVHVDTWNSADPQKIIDLIPQDVRPYTVLVLSLSILHDDKTSTPAQCRWRQVENGIETARSWIKVAADNRMWAMVQPSSGGFTHFPDYDGNADLETTVYGEFFRDYPNFLGFNYAEQFWGFDQTCSPSADKRWEHWANLLKLTNKYGGYLDVSFTGGSGARRSIRWRWPSAARCWRARSGRMRRISSSRRSSPRTTASTTTKA